MVGIKEAIKPINNADGNNHNSSVRKLNSIVLKAILCCTNKDIAKESIC